jgi:hypothetical protein
MFIGATKHPLVCDVSLLTIFAVTRHFAFALPRSNGSDSEVNIVTKAWTV